MRRQRVRSRARAEQRIAAPLAARTMALATLALGVLGLAAFAACKKPPRETFPAHVDVVTGDAARGAALVAHFECNRCHAGLAAAAPVKAEKACIGCHEEIVSGRFQASETAIAKWRPLVSDLRYAPTLAQAGRFRADWLERFLLHPHDLRPALRMSMPRLAMTEAQAKDIVAHLKTDGAKGALAATLPKGDAARGQALLAGKGCMTCHRMTGGPAVAASPIPVPMTAEQMARSMALAPDLRHARDRMTPVALAAWIAKPSAMKADADMPDLPLTKDEADDIATFLLTAPLAPVPATPFTRLPVLSRPVKFEEVDKKVFHRTCWHCHSEPDFAIGDGGPGNSGGFGFGPRGVDLSSYQGVMTGYFETPPAKGEVGKRKSLAAPTKDGTPRLLAALLARHGETSSGQEGEVRGMPLGLPPLSAEDIQLVETWIAQGRPR